jgi:predicted dehydrogenase
VAKESGKMLFLAEDRTYISYEEMMEKESKLPADKRIDFVTIVTPNFAHFAPAMLALEKGFHVVIEKPITFTIDEARQLKKKVEETGLILLLDSYLLRLSHGTASSNYGEGRRTWKNSQGICRVSARLVK